MGYKALESSYQHKKSVNNFGRTERIGGNKWEAMIDVDLDEQLDWALVIDTKAVVIDPISLFPLGSVRARVNFGSGNGDSDTIVDATDFILIPVAGNHVKVALTLVATQTVTTPSGGTFNGSSIPTVAPRTDVPGFLSAPAPQTAGALVSCFLSADYAQRAFLSAIDEHIVPVFGTPPAPLFGTALTGVVSQVPVRLNAVSATNPGASTVFLQLYSSPTVPVGPHAPAQLLKKVIAIPAGQTVVTNFAQSVPFDAGLSWVASTNPDLVAPAGTPIRVDIELVRRPTVKGVSTIAPTG